MLRKVFLYGPLRGDGPVTVVANTAAEVIEALSLQLHQLKPDLNGRKHIQVVGFETFESLYVPLGAQTELHLVPAVCLHKEGGLKTLIGAVLIALSFPAPAGLRELLFSAGTYLLFGGISQMFAPQRRANAAETETRYLGSPANTTAPGTPIPVLLGRHLVQGHVLSFDVDATTQAA